jgi:hypothetical protein
MLHGVNNIKKYQNHRDRIRFQAIRIGLGIMPLRL